MRVKNESSLRFLQRVPAETRSPPSAPAARSAPAPRTAPQDGFESAATARAAVSAAPSRSGDVQSMLREQFGTLAANEARFHETLRNVFGEGYDAAKAEGYRQQALAGDFGWMPPVRWVDAETLQGGHGAYDAQSGAVLLNRDLQADPTLAASTYVEEAGHHLDAQLNTVDSQGDEGELFRRILGGERLTGAQVAEMRAENDKGLIQLDGRSVEVEFRRGFFGRIGDAIGNGVRAVANTVSNAVGTVVDTAKDVANAVVSVGSGVVGGVVTAAKGIGQGLGGFVSNLVQGDVADAFQSLVRGVDMAIFQAPQRILNGLYDAGEHLLDGVSGLVGGRIGEGIRNVGTRLLDAGRTMSDTIMGVARDAYRTLTETPLAFARGVEEALELAGQGEWGAAAQRFGRGILDAGIRGLGGVVDAGVRLLQGGVNAVATATFIEPPSRALSDAEIQMLRQVYGDSIDYSQVRLKVGGLTDRLDIAPHVVGNTIYMRTEWGGPAFNPDGTLTESGMETLMHEAGHIWQNQNGGGDFVHKALLAQRIATMETGSRDAAYEWREGFAQGQSFEELNPEQQAHLIEDIGIGVMNDGTVQASDWSPPLSDAELSYVMNAWEMVRRGEGAR